MSEGPKDVVTCVVKDAIATVTFNRPERLNALNADVVQRLTAILPTLEQDEGVRAVILRGAGGHFMSGGDVKGFHETVGEAASARRPRYEQIIHRLHVPLFALRRMPKPTIASVSGACVGVGLSFLMACDLAIAAEDALFSLAYIRLGTSPDGSSTYSLPRLVGLRKALELALLGDRFGAVEAERLGLVNRVVAADALERETAALAKRLAEGPTYALGATKRLLLDSLETGYAEQLLHEAESFAACASRDDFREGVSAFVEKRPARFTGR